MSVFLKFVLSLVNLMAIAGMLLWPFIRISVSLPDPVNGYQTLFQSYLILMANTYPIGVVAGNYLFWSNLRKAPLQRLTLYTLLSISMYLLLLIPMLISDLVR